MSYFFSGGFAYCGVMVVVVQAASSIARQPSANARALLSRLPIGPPEIRLRPIRRVRPARCAGFPRTAVCATTLAAAQHGRRFWNYKADWSASDLRIYVARLLRGL